MHRLGCTGFFLSGTLLEFRMFFCIIEEESTQDNTQDNSYTGNVFMERRASAETCERQCFELAVMLQERIE